RTSRAATAGCIGPGQSEVVHQLPSVSHHFVRAAVTEVNHTLAVTIQRTFPTNHLLAPAALRLIPLLGVQLLLRGEGDGWRLDERTVVALVLVRVGENSHQDTMKYGHTL